MGVGFVAALALGQWASAERMGTMAVSPVLDELLKFHPTWVTRSVTSHDQWGGNGDGGGDGNAREGDYHVLFHGKGEGRITRIWMTDTWNDSVAKDWKELWIQIDGQTVFRGSPMDFFAGKSIWKAPLVLSYPDSSGGFTSYVPFPYSHEAKVLLSGDPHYFHVTYRQGAGSSSGPSAQELTHFMTERWWETITASSPLVAGHADAAAPMTLAAGPKLVSGVMLLLNKAEDLRRLRVRVGSDDPVPASFFFGLGSTGEEPADGGWAAVTSSIHHVDPDKHWLATRLPIPLQAGESLSIESADGASVDFHFRLMQAPAPRTGVHLMTQYRDQWGPGTETTMSYFDSEVPTQFVSLVERISDGKPGERTYLEGDEMIRTDRMAYPLQLGTGTEDYFNGGWYFLGAHSNPFSGQPRFIVNDPDDGWSHAKFEHSLYRDHIADPVVSRGGMRFGFEAGETGSYSPVRYRTLGMAYTFSGVSEISRTKVALSDIRSEGTVEQTAISSAVDAERNQHPMSYESRTSRGRSTLTLACDSAQEPIGVNLIRSYDAINGGQQATVRVNGREAGMLFESYANPYRRYAQDAIWIDLSARDCVRGTLSIEIDSSASQALWSEAGYEVVFYGAGMEGGLHAEDAATLRQGPRIRIIDSTVLDGTPHYINDHTIIQGEDGTWHLYGIYHAEPFDPEHEFQFIHATHPGALTFPDHAQFDKVGIALERQPQLGETHIWAPHAMRDGDRYVMVFQSGGAENDRTQIRLAESRDLNHWQRVGDAPLFEDICVARDPMLRKSGDLWTLYYTRCNDTVSHRSGVAYRTSTDLTHWSEPRMALVRADTPPMFNSGFTESPFVFEKDGWFYLSVTSYPIAEDATFVFRSHSPFSFPSEPYARLSAHAAEWLHDSQGNLLMTSAGPGNGGVWLMPVSGF